MRSRQAPGSSWLRQRRTASLICWPLKPKLLLLWPLRVAVRFPTVGAAENSPAKPASTLTLSSPAWCSSLPQATSREQRGLALLPTLLQPAARQSAGIPLPWRLSPSVPGLKLAVVAACSNPSRPIKLPLPASSEAHVACLTCPSMLILIQVSGYLTVHQLKARPLAGVKGWWIVGGTSVSSPALAGVANSAGHFATSSENELTTIYSNLGNTADFHDIAVDYCGPFAGFTSKTGWDFCTGVGSVHGNAGK